MTATTEAQIELLRAALSELLDVAQNATAGNSFLKLL